NGLTQNLTATGSYSDGTLADLSGSVTWTPADGTVVSISATGVAKGLKVGNTTVTAAWVGVTSAAITITVTAAVLESIAVTPDPATLFTGATQQFKAVGTLSDATTPDITATVTWKSSNLSVATITPGGLATAIAAGGTMTLFASNPGSWGNDIAVGVALQP